MADDAHGNLWKSRMPHFPYDRSAGALGAPTVAPRVIVENDGYRFDRIVAPRRTHPLASVTITPSVSERPPTRGELVQVRSRRWLVEEVVEPDTAGRSLLVRLACADDDAQGQTLDVFWDYELDRRILEEEGWGDLATKGFDAPRQFAAFLHTLRWGCVTATDPNLFQSPFRAGIKIDAYLSCPVTCKILW